MAVPPRNCKLPPPFLSKLLSAEGAIYPPQADLSETEMIMPMSFTKP
jgi:hypothetical protein